jgi:hypothetical protein
MNKNEIVEIPLSKKKMIFGLCGSLMFVAIGVWFIAWPDSLKGSVIRNPTILFIVGLLSIVFFGICVFFYARMLSNVKPGLIIDDQGITDHSSGVAVGMIPWEDIGQIKTAKVFSQSFVMLIVKDPVKYIDREKSLLKKKTMQMNYKSYGSPVAISANSLKIGFDELHKIIQERYSRHLNT